MILLLATIINIAYTFKIRLPTYAIAILMIIMLSTIIGVVLLVIKGFCNAFIALIDMFAALIILILLLKRLNKSVI